MKSATINITREQESNRIEMIDFYNKATEDYEFWSKDYNMHFGYFTPIKTNIFRRNTMLNEMNNQVITRLGVTKGKKAIVDLGCGMGGTMRYALKKNKTLTAFGVTLSEFQTKKGNQLLNGYNGKILKENYNQTSFPPNSFDGALAIESFCHSGHSIKALNEAYKILKPNGKLVIADAFLKKAPPELCFGANYVYQKLCNHWRLEKLETTINMVDKLKTAGFSNIKIEDVSFRVAPSVLHVPFAIIFFALQNILKLNGFKRESLHNLKGSFFALLSGLHINSFGYYIITCTK